MGVWGAGLSFRLGAGGRVWGWSWGHAWGVYQRGWVSGVCAGLGNRARGGGCHCCLGPHVGNGDGADTCEGRSRRPRAGSSSPTCVLGLLQGPAQGLADPGWVLAPGVLQVNQAALARASGRHLRLLPQQRYLQVERADVSTLERKRNVLCCLITRILKVEKQLHIDNLVFRVWRD